MREFKCSLCGKTKIGNVSKKEVVVCHTCVKDLMWTPATKVYALADKFNRQGKEVLGRVLAKHFTDEGSKDYRRVKSSATMPQIRTERAVLA